MQQKRICIVVDSREKMPYDFPSSTIIKPLKAGDYSLENYEDQITIERKSKSDAYHSFGTDRSRFIRELEKLAKYKYSAIIIESSLENFLQPPPFSRMKPKSAINSILAWHIRYDVNIFWAGNRLLGQTLTYRLLEKYWKESVKK